MCTHYTSHKPASITVMLERIHTEADVGVTLIKWRCRNSTWAEQRNKEPAEHNVSLSSLFSSIHNLATLYQTLWESLLFCVHHSSTDQCSFSVLFFHSTETIGAVVPLSFLNYYIFREERRKIDFSQASPSTSQLNFISFIISWPLLLWFRLFFI